MHVNTAEKSPFALKTALASYGIRSNPFPIDESDEFFFSTRNIGKQLAALGNLAEYGDLLLVISGVEGAGKTTALNQFQRAADARWSICRIDAQPAMTIDSLLEQLLTGFSVDTRGDDAVENERLLRSHLDALAARGAIALLAVDDAHLMPRACLDRVLGLSQHDGEPALRLLLTTEPARLGISTDDAKRVHVVVLEPFDMQQCGDYLNMRLSHAGLVGDSPFSNSVVEAIHQDSGGIPGEIHPLALHALLANAKSQGLRRRPVATRRALLYLALVLAVAGAGALLLSPDPDRDALATKDPGATGKVRGYVATNPAPTPAPAAGAKSSPLRSDIASTEATRRPRAAGTQTAKMFVTDTGQGSKRASVDGDRPATIAAAAVTTPAPVKRTAPAAVGQPAVDLASNVTPAVVSATPATTAYDLEWLRGQNPSHYVIQLVGTRSADAARDFVERHALAGKAGPIAITHEKKPWHVVLYGVYPDATAARAAIAALPAPLRAGSPWPRSVASVLVRAR